MLKDYCECENIIFYSDSLLVVNQINGKYKVIKPELEFLKQSCVDQMKEYTVKVKVKHIRREKNKQAEQGEINGRNQENVDDE